MSSKAIISSSSSDDFPGDFTPKIDFDLPLLTTELNRVDQGSSEHRTLSILCLEEGYTDLINTINHDVLKDKTKAQAKDLRKKLSRYDFSSSLINTCSYFALYALYLGSKTHNQASVLNKQEDAFVYTEECQQLETVDKPLKEKSKEYGRMCDLAFPGLGTNIYTNELVWTPVRKGEYELVPENVLSEPQDYILNVHDWYISKAVAEQKLAYLAGNNLVNPVKEKLLRYAESSSMSVDEAKEIIFSIPSTYMHIDEQIPNHVFGRFMVASAYLYLDYPDAITPCFVPIIGGQQGCYKSSFIEHLFGDTEDSSFYSQVAPGCAEKFFKEVEAKQTSACMEFPEIEAWLNHKYLEPFKGLVGAKNITGRRMYGRRNVNFKRYAVWIGTTNHPERIIIDRSSPYDRRWIPMSVPSGKYIDTEQVVKDKAKIWTAAVVLAQANEIFMPWTIPASLFKELGNYQEAYVDEEPMEAIIIQHVQRCNTVTCTSIMSQCFNVPANEITKADKSKVNSLLKLHLPSMGFVRKKITQDKRQLWGWIRTAPLSELDHIDCNPDM